MKIRIGFVSNSSSSSFVIVSKKGNLNAKKLIKAFDVGEQSPLYDLVCEMAKTLVDNSKEMTLEDLYDYYGASNVEELPEDIQKALKTKGTLYVGECSNDSGEKAETVLCDSCFDYEDSDVVLLKEGGF